MSIIELTLQQKNHLTDKLQKYFNNELNHELEQFDAEFLLEFIAEEMGAYFYNKGLEDSQTILHDKIDIISEAIYEIERPTF